MYDDCSCVLGDIARSVKSVSYVIFALEKVIDALAPLLEEM